MERAGGAAALRVHRAPLAARARAPRGRRAGARARTSRRRGWTSIESRLQQRAASVAPTTVSARAVIRFASPRSLPFSGVASVTMDTNVPVPTAAPHAPSMAQEPPRMRLQPPPRLGDALGALAASPLHVRVGRDEDGRDEEVVLRAVQLHGGVAEDAQRERHRVALLARRADLLDDVHRRRGVAGVAREVAALAAREGELRRSRTGTQRQLGGGGRDGRGPRRRRDSP